MVLFNAIWSWISSSMCTILVSCWSILPLWYMICTVWPRIRYLEIGLFSFSFYLWLFRFQNWNILNYVYYSLLLIIYSSFFLITRYYRRKFVGYYRHISYLLTEKVTLRSPSGRWAGSFEDCFYFFRRFFFAYSPGALKYYLITFSP